MKIALLSGAYKNAGDFLIVRRCKELLQAVIPNCEITEFARNKNLEDKIDAINKMDVLVLGGSGICQKPLSWHYSVGK